ncbi:unnamed protein product [Trichogramma brassicae]|uniref:Uncharacterized protein n=1 Tax=Trichogramma brassicae TaxID=86971 RepID=A0A6H5IFZ4_9HYME|nr:unnamed protein product [Trichogramma brassicae]
MFNSQRYDVLKLLVERGLDVNHKDDRGMTLLHHVMDLDEHQLMKEDMVKLLIEHGADVNAKSLYGPTPLHLAVNNGHDNLIELLVDSGADNYLIIKIFFLRRMIILFFSFSLSSVSIGEERTNQFDVAQSYAENNEFNFSNSTTSFCDTSILDSKSPSPTPKKMNKISLESMEDDDWRETANSVVKTGVKRRPSRRGGTYKKFKRSGSARGGKSSTGIEADCCIINDEIQRVRRRRSTIVLLLMLQNFTAAHHAHFNKYPLRQLLVLNPTDIHSLRQDLLQQSY